MSDTLINKDAKKAFAIHGKTEDGQTHIVGIGNLRVIITNDDGSWFAQGLEIDYAAQGTSMDDVKERFGRGLYSTVKENLKLYGDIKNLLHPAPHEVWVELFNCGKEFKRLTHIGMHEIVPAEAMLPFDGVEYLAVAA